jgi:hypothetical protein
MVENKKDLNINASSSGTTWYRGIQTPSTFPKKLLSAVPQFRRLWVGFTRRQPGTNPRAGHVGFVDDKVALGQDFPQYFGSPKNFHSINCSTLITHHIITCMGDLYDGVWIG